MVSYTISINLTCTKKEKHNTTNIYPGVNSQKFHIQFYLFVHLINCLWRWNNKKNAREEAVFVYKLIYLNVKYIQYLSFFMK